MITYEYFCEANGKTVEVSHRMSESFQTWGEVCQKANLPLNGTCESSPVERLISGGLLFKGESSNKKSQLPMADPGCGRSNCCRH
ncbi:zinc ribbon domain-containing protein [Gimesia sp.]|uniref:zinc ribbon domain-containing protein n=1 Tax=Gimesia sp. TaxID=2024833 RepID=UPI003A92A187